MTVKPPTPAKTAGATAMEDMLAKARPGQAARPIGPRPPPPPGFDHVLEPTRKVSGPSVPPSDPSANQDENNDPSTAAQLATKAKGTPNAGRLLRRSRLTPRKEPATPPVRA